MVVTFPLAPLLCHVCRKVLVRPARVEVFGDVVSSTLHGVRGIYLNARIQSERAWERRKWIDRQTFTIPLIRNRSLPVVATTRSRWAK
jgi:hypothetical protein